MSAELQTALLATDVTAGYGGDPVIRDVSVRAGPGQVISVVGPNGSGKSTLLKAITGVLRVSAGHVSIRGRDVTNAAPEDMARTGVGYVPQSNFWPKKESWRDIYLQRNIGGKKAAGNQAA